jgi:hypothetical protein
MQARSRPRRHQRHFRVLPCTGVLLVYRHAPKNVARQEVEGCKEEACRKDTIIMSLTQRIPELEASPEPREDHVATSESTDKVRYPGAAGALRAPLVALQVLLFEKLSSYLSDSFSRQLMNRGN